MVCSLISKFCAYSHADTTATRPGGTIVSYKPAYVHGPVHNARAFWHSKMISAAPLTPTKGALPAQDIAVSFEIVRIIGIGRP